MGKNNKQGSELGRVFIRRLKDRGSKQKRRPGTDTYVQEWADPSQDSEALDSVLDQSDLNAIAQRATMAQTRFTAEKQNMTIVQTNSSIVPEAPDPEVVAEQRKHWNDLVIPRRPVWVPGTDQEKFLRAERDAYLSWRRRLAELESNEKLLLTPFEKNLEVWKQLWYVIERSDVVMQILDARDPLLFRSVDLERYVDEFSERKVNVLVLNKADLLSKEQRRVWTRYFDQVGLHAFFFSALLEQEKLLEGSRSEPREEGLRKSEEREEDSNEEELSNVDESRLALVDGAKKPSEDSCDTLEANDSRVLNREELIGEVLKLAHRVLGHRDCITIGMVGYPNVGKSTTVNALYEKKKVCISETPGKTKRFQTLQLTPNVILCDCPGLVFPTFMSTRTEMLCSGLLRIAEMRECLAPISVLTRCIPRKELEHVYKLRLRKASGTLRPDASAGSCTSSIDCADPKQFLDVYCNQRKFYLTSKKPDQFRAAKQILKDLVNGRLLFCRAPPNLDQCVYSRWTKYQNPDLRRPTIPGDRKLSDSAPADETLEGEASSESDSDDSVEEAELDDQEIECLTSSSIRSTAQSKAAQTRYKHVRVDKRREKRRCKKHLLQKYEEFGVYNGFVPGSKSSLQHLPTTVRL